MRGRLARWWKTFWFSEGSPESLGVLRVAFFLTLFVLAVNEPYAASITASPVSFWRPVWIISHLTGAPPAYPVLHALELLWDAALLTSALGLVTRLSTAIAAILSLYFVGLQNSFGTVSHGHTPAVLCTVVFALSACADGVSLDALLRRPKRTHEAAARYHWPIQLVRTIWCIMFLSAGIAKLTRGGAAWVFSDNLATLMLVAPHRYPEAATASLTPGLGTWLAHSPRFCVGLAFATVTNELFAPLALLGGRWPRLVVGFMACMQIGVYLTMFENFVWLLPLYLAWVDAQSLMARGWSPSSNA